MERLLPARVVDLPTDVGFTSVSNSSPPDGAVAFIISNIQAIDNRQPAAQVTLGFDRNIVFTPFHANGWIEGQAHGNRVWQADSIFAGLSL